MRRVGGGILPHRKVRQHAHRRKVLPLMCMRNVNQTPFIRTMANLTIKTNSVPRECVMGMYLWGSLKQELKAQFNYLTEDEFDMMEFFKYKGDWYSVGDFMRVDSDSPFVDKNSAVNINWNGYSSDSYFSGILIRYKYDGTVIVGRYCS